MRRSLARSSDLKPARQNGADHDLHDGWTIDGPDLKAASRYLKDRRAEYEADVDLPLLAADLVTLHGRAGSGRRGGGRCGSVILPAVRDPRFVTIRRGGTLTDPDHRLLALWAASCAEHVLDLFELARPQDLRPREAIEHARAWARGEVRMMEARAAGGHAMGAARDLRGAARHAAYAAGQAACVAHVAAHELGAAAYAIRAARAAAREGQEEAAGRLECGWQRDQLPEAIRELVLDDQRLRNDICWSVFDG